VSLLESQSVTVSIGSLCICTDLNYRLQRGECWGILGANGAGKTTLLHVLAGLKKPVRGTVRVDSRDIRSFRRKDLARRMGILFQDSEDTFPSTVMETVLTGRYPHLPFWALESEQDIAISEKALEQVSLLPMRSRQVNTLSGGERRRLSIAVLLAQAPDIWLLDEPTNHLDLRYQMILLKLIKEQVARTAGGIIMVLHDVNLVTRFCTHALLMTGPDCLLAGPVAEVITGENLEALYRHPLRRVTEQGVSFCYPL